MPAIRSSSRGDTTSQSRIETDSDDEVEALFFGRARRSTRNTPSSASETPARIARSGGRRRIVDPDDDEEDDDPDGTRIISYGEDSEEEEEEEVPDRRSRLHPRKVSTPPQPSERELAAASGRELSTAPPARDRLSTPLTPLPQQSRDVSSPLSAPEEAGPSRRSRGRTQSRLIIEIPFMLLAELEQYELAPGLSLPTNRSRRRVLAEQQHGTSKLILTPSKRKRRRAVSSDSGFGGYGDDSEDLHDEDDDIEDWESDGASSDVVAHRVTRPRQTRRKRDPAAMHTRSRKHKSRSRMDSLPSSPVASGSTRNTRRRGSDDEIVDATFLDEEGEEDMEEGEDEIDSFYAASSRSSTPEQQVTKAPTRPILENHRGTCDNPRCGLAPADVLLEAARKKKKGGRKQKPKDADDLGVIDDEEHALSLGGWLECEKCSAAFHWKCIPEALRKQVIMAFNSRHRIGIDEVAIFVCKRCDVYPVCFVCKKESAGGATAGNTENEPIDVDDDGVESTDEGPQKAAGDDNEEADGDRQEAAGGVPVGSSPKGATGPPSTNGSPKNTVEPTTFVNGSNGDAPSDSEQVSPNLIPSKPAPLLFRCKRCKQACHYGHLRSPFPEDERYTLPRLAEAYQKPGSGGQNEWECHMCRDWPWRVDRIIAWRPLPADAVEPEYGPGELPNYRARLPREYLIKWVDRGFRHTSWVPHSWLESVTPLKLKHFIEKGPQFDLVTDDTLAAKGDDMERPTIDAVMQDHEATSRHHPREVDDLEAKWEGHGPPPDVNAQASLPVAWSTIDRVLDVWLLPPKKSKKKGKSKNKRIVSSESDEDDELSLEAVVRDGVQPQDANAIWIDQWEEMTGRVLYDEDLDEVAPLVTWCLVKWCDLQYDQSCSDTPPPVDSPLYPAFKTALRRYLAARRIEIPVLTPRERKERDEAAEDHGDPPAEQPACVVGGTLMPFQVEGFQWLLYKHFRREGCILADDMGLGKTIQVSSFLGYLASDELKIYPSLVVVPNSTITNWVREFEKWVPHVRVVPYYGEAASRKIISKYELYHPGLEHKPRGLKAHVILTTYDTICGTDFKIFNAVPRWETLVVDEGQAVKNDTGLLFNRLKKLHVVHRVLLTGTPLNNNLRELFNLLNFLDEANFKNLKDLEERFTDLSENLVVELHEMLKPYILRRVKADVLKLPPKVEIIVPISMTPAQRHLYKRILFKYRDVISGILQQRKRKAPKAPKAAAAPQEASTSAAGAANAAGDVEMVDLTADTALASPALKVNGHAHPNGDVPSQVNGDAHPTGTKENGDANGAAESCDKQTASEELVDAQPATHSAGEGAPVAGSGEDMGPILTHEMDLD